MEDLSLLMNGFATVLSWQNIGLMAIGILLGMFVGVLLQYQRRFLYQERENQAIRSGKAADEERRRIAREVHDVIAHSLSITLLHLTAARRALQTDDDPTEAVEALVEAERLGRQAMADIRRTVGMLDAGPAQMAPEPGAADIDEGAELGQADDVALAQVAGLDFGQKALFLGLARFLGRGPLR